MEGSSTGDKAKTKSFTYPKPKSVTREIYKSSMTLKQVHRSEKPECHRSNRVISIKYCSKRVSMSAKQLVISETKVYSDGLHILLLVSGKPSNALRLRDSCAVFTEPMIRGWEPNST